MSKASKEIMIKLVLQTIPIYTMCCFQVLDNILDEIYGILSNFWWNGKLGERKIHWVAWKSLSRAKENGGLDFRDSKAFNRALLGKQGWRLLTQPHSMLVRVLRVNYYPDGDSFASSLGHRRSWSWRSLHGALDLIRLGGRKTIGGGQQTKICIDPWILRTGEFHVRQPENVPGTLRMVTDLIDMDLGSWGLNRLTYFDTGDVDVIHSIPLRNLDRIDR